MNIDTCLHTCVYVICICIIHNTFKIYKIFQKSESGQISETIHFRKKGQTRKIFHIILKSSRSKLQNI